jgi:hypothetical protein
MARGGCSGKANTRPFSPTLGAYYLVGPVRLWVQTPISPSLLSGPGSVLCCQKYLASLHSFVVFNIRRPPASSHPLQPQQR